MALVIRCYDRLSSSGTRSSPRSRPQAQSRSRFTTATWAVRRPLGDRPWALLHATQQPRNSGGAMTSRATTRASWTRNAASASAAVATPCRPAAGPRATPRPPDSVFSACGLILTAFLSPVCARCDRPCTRVAVLQDADSSIAMPIRAPSGVVAKIKLKTCNAGLSN